MPSSTCRGTARHCLALFQSSWCVLSQLAASGPCPISLRFHTAQAPNRLFGHTDSANNMFPRACGVRIAELKCYNKSCCHSGGLRLLCLVSYVSTQKPDNANTKKTALYCTSTIVGPVSTCWVVFSNARYQLGACCSSRFGLVQIKTIKTVGGHHRDQGVVVSICRALPDSDPAFK